nr:hypothetical protein [uncultured Rhodopila sp.]
MDGTRFPDWGEKETGDGQGATMNGAIHHAATTVGLDIIFQSRVQRVSLKYNDLS